jgi:CRP-like cAMP-binding protein
MNQLLASLPQEVRSLLDPDLQRVEMRRGDVLYYADQPVEHVFFPNGGLVSIVVQMDSGQTAETSVVGRDGLVCSAIVLDVQDAIDQATVEIETDGLRISAAAFIKIYRSNERLRNVVNRYHAMVIAEARQSTACNALHAADKRLCRWLAHARDQTGQDELQLTHEFLARMLGVRRTTISDGLGPLQAQGIITLNRGYIKILDAEALQAQACECYGILKKRFGHVFPEWAKPLAAPP